MRHWRWLVLDESALRRKNNWDDLDGFHGNVRYVGRSVGLTWPQLQQVVQRFDVPFEVHSARHLLAIIETLHCSSSRLPPFPPPRILGWCEEHRPEAHGKVLMSHPVGGAERCYEAEVVEQERQSGLRVRDGEES